MYHPHYSSNELQRAQTYLYGSFQRKHRYFKVIVLIEKLMLMVVALFLLGQKNQFERLMFAEILIGVNWLLVMKTQPYSDNIENLMDVSCRLTNTFNVLVGLSGTQEISSTIDPGGLETLQTSVLGIVNTCNILFVSLGFLSGPLREWAITGADVSGPGSQVPADTADPNQKGVQMTAYVRYNSQRMATSGGNGNLAAPLPETTATYGSVDDTGAAAGEIDELRREISTMMFPDPASGEDVEVTGTGTQPTEMQKMASLQDMNAAVEEVAEEARAGVGDEPAFNINSVLDTIDGQIGEDGVAARERLAAGAAGTGLLDQKNMGKMGVQSAAKTAVTEKKEKRKSVMNEDDRSSLTNRTASESHLLGGKNDEVTLSQKRKDFFHAENSTKALG